MNKLGTDEHQWLMKVDIICSCVVVSARSGEERGEDIGWPAD